MSIYLFPEILHYLQDKKDNKSVCTILIIYPRQFDDPSGLKLSPLLWRTFSVILMPLNAVNMSQRCVRGWKPMAFCFTT